MGESSEPGAQAAYSPPWAAAATARREAKPCDRVMSVAATPAAVEARGGWETGGRDAVV